MKCVVELPPPAAEDDADDGRVPLGARLVGTLPPAAVGEAALPGAPGRDEFVPLGAGLVGALPPVVVGVPALPDAPGEDEVPSLIGAAPFAVPALEDAAPVSFEDVAQPATTMELATTVATAAVQPPRRSNNRRPRISTFHLAVTAGRDNWRLPRAWPPTRYAADDVGGLGTCLCSLSAVASGPTMWPDDAKWSGRPQRLPNARRFTDFSALVAPFAATRGTAPAATNA
jgi:hypothetical protein